MQEHDLSVVVLSAATASRDAGRRQEILRLMGHLRRLLRDEIGCAQVSPVLEGAFWRWMLIGELRQDDGAHKSVARFLSFEAFGALKSIAATDCYFLQPARFLASAPGQGPDICHLGLQAPENLANLSYSRRPQ